MNQKPSVGRIVHYVYNNCQHEAAIITAVDADGSVHLVIFSISGSRVTLRPVIYADPPEQFMPSWHWPERDEAHLGVAVDLHAGHFPREMMQTGGAEDCDAKLRERCRFLELDLANEREALKSICDDVLVALAGSGVGTPEEGYFKESGRPWIKHDILKLREDRDQLRFRLESITKRDTLLKWLDGQMDEHNTMIRDARNGQQWERERYLCGCKDTLLSVKQHLQGPQ